ncbi:LysM peptidoglycan-binding domain-containing protein [Solimonas soli]|uniref:LysM peptidoglycan-binding domain-containing protein n=1 Tax=Solimonas soli TaxID=413479 RepID=UPI0004885544|nr:LysM domain-containing protein [Solimonas soli]
MRKYNGLTIIHGALAAALLTACAGRAPLHSEAPASQAPQAAPSQAAEPAVMPPPRQQGAPVALREDAPLRYVVKKGDTLWGIANHFIKQPWQWPEIWYVNDQVKNPHLIYPGDVLTLVWRDGRPMIMAADGLSADTEYLSPRVRELPLAQAIPTIPLESIRDFLSNPRLVDAEQLRDAPYILSFVDPHVIEGAGSLIYMQKLPNGGRTRWDAIRLGSKMVDPDSGELLGWEGTPVGAVEVRAFGTPATGLITRSDREALAGDRLIPPADETLDTNFYPHAPTHRIGGRILSVYDGVSQIGQYQVVTLNRGRREGIEPGHVLSILQAGRQARDPYSNHLVALPELYAGTLMVFKVESKVSYALVMSAVREIHTLDRVEQPQDGERF